MIRVIKVSFVVNEVSFGKSLCTLRMGDYLPGESTTY